MRNSHRSRRGSRLDDERNVAGVGELRAVAERLLETGAQYLEQGREWLHAATRREQDDGGPRARGGPGSKEGFGPPAQGFRGGEEGRGPYAPDETSFSSTGGRYDARAHAGYDYDDHRSRDFDTHADRLARGRQGTGRRGRDAFEDWADAYLPGNYGFGGEGRSQTGAPASDPHRAHGGRSVDEAASRWEGAYRAQGYGGHRGRGPRGYTRSDERILDDVNERLCDDPIVDAGDIEVRCESGCVVLEGRVPTRWMKHRAEDIADAVSGVKDVDNRIRVAAEGPVAQGDFDTGRGRSGATYSDDDPAGRKAKAGGGSTAAGTASATRPSTGPASTSGATGAATGSGDSAQSQPKPSPGNPSQEPQAPH